MAGRGPPSSQKDSANDHSPRITGRSSRTTPSSSAQSQEERRDLLRNLLSSQGNESLERVSHQAGMPVRSDYPSHDTWLRAVLTASLQQSDSVRDMFGHAPEERDQTGNNEDPNEDQSETKDGDA